VISFLSSAKAFSGRNRDNQLKAVRSWLTVSPEAEVILYGNSPGGDEVCRELGMRYVPDVKSTPAGVPYFDAIAEHARQNARYDTQVYLNCDILMTSSLCRAINSLTFKKYLMIGQRIDLAEDADFDVERADWMDQLEHLRRTSGASLHLPSGKDYFVFPRGLWEGIPSFVVGRIGYDDGLLAFCLERHIPIIDATCDVVSVHQYHDYNHLPGKRDELYHGSDFKHNVAALDTIHSAPLVSDAEWTLHFGKLEKTYANRDYLRYAELFVRYRMGWLLPSYALRALWRILAAFGICHVGAFTIDEVLKGYALTLARADTARCV
jgi:hypothetical protein